MKSINNSLVVNFSKIDKNSSFEIASLNYSIKKFFEFENNINKYFSPAIKNKNKSESETTKTIPLFLKCITFSDESTVTIGNNASTSAAIENVDALTPKNILAFSHIDWLSNQYNLFNFLSKTNKPLPIINFQLNLSSNEEFIQSIKELFNHLLQESGTINVQTLKSILNNIFVSNWEVMFVLSAITQKNYLTNMNECVNNNNHVTKSDIDLIVHHMDLLVNQHNEIKIIFNFVKNNIYDKKLSGLSLKEFMLINDLFLSSVIGSLFNLSDYKNTTTITKLFNEIEKFNKSHFKTEFNIIKTNCLNDIMNTCNNKARKLYKNENKMMAQYLTTTYKLNILTLFIHKILLCFTVLNSALKTTFLLKTLKNV